MKTLTGKVITAPGAKPNVPVKWGRENFWIYGAIEPLTGDHFLHEYPQLNGEYFQEFLDWLSQQLGEDYAILQIDQASAHMTEERQRAEGRRQKVRNFEKLSATGFQAPKFIYATKKTCISRCIAQEILRPYFKPLTLVMGISFCPQHSCLLPCRPWRLDFSDSLAGERYSSGSTTSLPRTQPN